MKKYSDYKKNKRKKELTDDEMSLVEWTKFKIIVPTENDKYELMDAFRHFHDEGFDSDFIACNQLAHEYLNGDNILVNEKMFNSLNKKRKSLIIAIKDKTVKDWFYEFSHGHPFLLSEEADIICETRADEKYKWMNDYQIQELVQLRINAMYKKKYPNAKKYSLPIF